MAGVWADPRSGAREETDRKSGAAQVSPHKEITQTRIFSHGFIRYWSRLKVRFVKNQLLLRGPAAAICTPTHAGAALLQRYVTSHYSEANAFNNLWRHIISFCTFNGSWAGFGVLCHRCYGSKVGPLLTHGPSIQPCVHTSIPSQREEKKHGSCLLIEPWTLNRTVPRLPGPGGMAKDENNLRLLFNICPALLASAACSSVYIIPSHFLADITPAQHHCLDIMW